LVRRLPYKRGFTNIWRVQYTPVNLDRLEGFAAGAEISPESLAAAGIIKRADEVVVILGRGEVNLPLTVKAHRFSTSARAKIEAAGGVAEELPLRKKWVRAKKGA